MSVMVGIFKEFWYIWAIIIVLEILNIFKPKIKGIIGEKTVSAILLMLDKDKYKLINDVYIDILGKTTQIDHIIVSDYGIFVIETKNYKGRIYGDEFSQYWTQVIYKRKDKLYNPIRQNYGHVEALKQVLNEFEGLNFVPIVVFSVKADLKVKTKTNTDVVYTTRLLKTIKRYEVKTISDDVRDAVYSAIKSINVDDKETRKQHVKAIHQNIADSNDKIKNDICPRCGGQLVIRKGKYGYFKGCSNYPKCRFVAKK